MRALAGATLASLVLVSAAQAQFTLAPDQHSTNPATPPAEQEARPPALVPQRRPEPRQTREDTRPQQDAEEARQRREEVRRRLEEIRRQQARRGEEATPQQPAEGSERFAGIPGMLTDPGSRCSVYVPGAPSGASVQWSGPCRDGLANGQGEYLLSAGGQILASTQGNFTGGRINGPGARIMANGDLYQGEFRDGRAAGRGTLQFRGSDGSTYEGEFRDDLPNGQGVRSWRNGARYTGAWVAGVRQGTGTMNYGNGTSYTGAWRNNQRSGIGTMNYGGGTTYEGSWANDQRNGTGTYRVFSPGGASAVYSGEWRNDMRNGFGSEVFPENNVRIDGNFLNDKPHGRVVYTSNGDRFEGEIYDGCLRTRGRVVRVISDPRGGACQMP
ncbi:MORN repeat-containing protein [Roseomonas xinghualingensis]|uniref:MORN repeat-containing protein n=1 Tax=Roseomonas xinghualingensis TaxID=2986475 RepID=UPI0021F13AB9|nr:hypothetical protein [Roseomonas sp. SXEYE001]MCV4206216.1 hypothetical protein [Roseomonas sp. SXEYE001]